MLPLRIDGHWAASAARACAYVNDVGAIGRGMTVDELCRGMG